MAVNSCDDYSQFTNTDIDFWVMRMLFICCRVNVGTGPSEERVLITGLHAVADIYCECCKTPLGWKYVSSVGVRLVNEQHYKQEQKQERNQFCRPLNNALTQQCTQN